jgi:hypothetical protein
MTGAIKILKITQFLGFIIISRILFTYTSFFGGSLEVGIMLSLDNNMHK